MAAGSRSEGRSSCCASMEHNTRLSFPLFVFHLQSVPACPHLPLALGALCLPHV